MDCNPVPSDSALHAAGTEQFATDAKPFASHRDPDMLKSIESTPARKLFAEAVENLAALLKNSPARQTYLYNYSFKSNMYIFHIKYAQH
jgi:hypothetical protein